MLSDKHILVLGATGKLSPSSSSPNTTNPAPFPGGIGLLFIKEALSLSSPPRLTLYVRNPSKLPPGIEDDKQVRIVVGELSNRQKLEEAVEGVDSVVSFLGAGPDLNTLIALFTRSKATVSRFSFSAERLR